MKGDEENAELVGSLSSLLRTTLSSQQEFVPLLTELEITQQYMDLMNFSLRHQIESTIEIKDELHMETVPRFILQPIIENCYKHGFSKRGGFISIRVEKTREALHISIEDDGAGMTVEALERVNDRLQPSKREIMERYARNEGTSAGIGLTNVYERLKLIYDDQFQMKLESEYQVGTKVVFVLPTSIMEEIIMYKVIIADDQMPVLEYLQAKLPWQELGLELLAACSDGEEALHACKKLPPDILITDIGMPIMNGLQLIEEARKLNPGLKTVILSCHEEFHFAQQAVKLNVNDYILKETMRIEQLVDILSQLITQLHKETTIQNDHQKLQAVVSLGLSSLKSTFLQSLIEQPVWDEGSGRIVL